MSTGAVFFAHKKRITERNSHLTGEASGSSISNGCQAKTECRRQLAGVGTGRGGTKLHASVAGSRVRAFLATAAPWEPYFTYNLYFVHKCQAITLMELKLLVFTFSISDRCKWPGLCSDLSGFTIHSVRSCVGPRAVRPEIEKGLQVCSQLYGLGCS
jgi:hypothetical protein